MKSEELKAMAARVMALDGPDREVDRDIAIALALPPSDYVRAVQHGREQPYWWHLTDTKAGYWMAEAHTASFDAAMSPVPVGWDAVQMYPPSGDVDCWAVHLIYPSGHTFTGTGKTHITAILAAALLALAAQKERTDEGS